VNTTRLIDTHAPPLDRPAASSLDRPSLACGPVSGEMSASMPGGDPTARERWLRGVRQCLAIVALGILPVFAIVTMIGIGIERGELAVDFHLELYRQAVTMLTDTSPAPPRGFDPVQGAHLIWPPLAAFVAAPFTVFSVGTAEILFAITGPLCYAVALRLVSVRDWRVYGALGLWPQVVGEVRLSHLTPLLALLLAAAWRARDRELRGGVWVGLAIGIKLLAWPLVVWLAAIGRRRAALMSATIPALSILLILPYTGLDEYFRALREVSSVFDQATYTVLGLFVQAGAPDVVGRVVTIVLVAALLAATWIYRSFTLAIVTALVASPIVWLDFFGLAAIPLAIARPRLSLVWFVPLATWGLEGAGMEIGDALSTARLFLVFGIVFAVAFDGERKAAVMPRRSRGVPQPVPVGGLVPDR
jgi:hypothetical protein